MLVYGGHRFDKHGVLGRGTFGQVEKVRAVGSRHGLFAAAKYFNSRASTDAEILREIRMFQKFCRIYTSNCNNVGPGIAKVTPALYFFGKNRSLCSKYVLMMPLASCTLLNAISSHTLNEKSKWNIVRDLLRAFKVLQTMKICHLDITANNVLMYNGLAQLGDFGAARSYRHLNKTTSLRARTTEYNESPEMMTNLHVKCKKKNCRTSCRWVAQAARWVARNRKKNRSASDYVMNDLWSLYVLGLHMFSESIDVICALRRHNELRAMHGCLRTSLDEWVKGACTEFGASDNVTAWLRFTLISDPELRPKRQDAQNYLLKLNVGASQ